MNVAATPVTSMREVDSDPSFSQAFADTSSSPCLFSTLMRMASAVLTSRISPDVASSSSSSFASTRPLLVPQHSGVPMNQEQSAVKHSLAAAVSSALGQACYLNETLGLSRGTKRTAFDSPPNKRAAISLADYVERAMRYTPAGKEVYALSLVYLSHYLSRHARSVVLTRSNVHRLWISAYVVAAKFMDDEFLSNGCYAKVAGLPVAEVNSLERQFLVGMNYSLASERVAADYAQISKPLLALVAKAKILASSAPSCVARASTGELSTGAVVVAVHEISEGFRTAVKSLRDSLLAAAAAAQATLQCQASSLTSGSLAPTAGHRPPSRSVSISSTTTNATSNQASPLAPAAVVAARRQRRSSSLSLASIPVRISA